MAFTQAGIDAEINSQLPSGTEGITANELRQVLHDMNASAFQSAVVGMAPPSGGVALISSAGVATTVLRSDVTLAISQSIAPTWTAPHVFSAGLAVGSVGTSGVLTLNGFTAGSSTIAVSPLGNLVTLTGSLGITGGLSIGTVGAPVQVAQRVSGSVSGTISTSDIPISIISGATIFSVIAYTTQAFGASGSLNLTAGTGLGDNVYIAAQNIKSLGVVTLLLNGTGAAGLSSLPAGAPNFFFRLTQTGTPSAAGNVIIVVSYLVLP